MEHVAPRFLSKLTAPFVLLGVLLIAGLAVCGSATPASGQTTAGTVADWSAAVSPDSLYWNLERLAGGAPVVITDTIRIGSDFDAIVLADTSIVLRDRFGQNREIARYFVESRLHALGYPTSRFVTTEFIGISESVLASRAGAERPDQKVIVGAHLDSVSGAPGADDNASGVAAVLEAARIFAELAPSVTVEFAFWDLEEAGLLGSRSYARAQADAGEDIVAVINLDMIGWESDGRRSVLLSRNSASEHIAAVVEDLVAVLGLDLELIPSTMGRSDHASFQGVGYPAVMLIEHFGADFNPRYHSPGDTIEEINLPYMTDIVRLAVASVGALAYPQEAVGVAVEASPRALPDFEGPYPNPATGQFRLDLAFAPGAEADVEVMDVLGRRVHRIQAPATGMVEIRVGDWPAGVYFLRVRAAGTQYLRTFAVVR